MNEGHNAPLKIKADKENKLLEEALKQDLAIPKEMKLVITNFYDPDSGSRGN